MKLMQIFLQYPVYEAFEFSPGIQMLAKLGFKSA